ncbi:MAG: histidine triad nucleotide-binding protein [Myxococcaceae bacterium]
MADCLFCNIVAGKVPANVVYRDAHCIGFDDIYPVAPVHVLFVPKRHIISVSTLTEADGEAAGQLLLAAATYARQKGIEQSGYRVVANVGPDAGQSVFHLHLHLLGGKPLHAAADTGRGD